EAGRLAHPLRRRPVHRVAPDRAARHRARGPHARRRRQVGSLGARAYFPTQKRAKISLIVASVTVSPVISPRLSAAILTSTARAASSTPARAPATASRSAALDASS